ncbi:MAG: DUF4136 domain-containing protein [Gammaproteobacteria bacterium]|nr:DUF4136 domain-containing protein [Gammaproteobacteria bacterium]
MRALLLGLCTLALTACATSGPTVSAISSPGVDLASFETFNYLPRLGTDRANGVRTPFSARLMEAMNHEMAIRGLRFAESPDLLVDFNFVTREGIRVRQSPNMSMSSVNRSHWGSSRSVWTSYQTTVRQYTEGTFLVDIIDVENAALIAEASARSRTSPGINELTQTEINSLVASMMAQMMP